MTARGHRDRGAALVEFALITPLLCLLLFGIVEFGLAYDLRQSVNSAAREGARTGAIPEAEAGGIEARVISSFNALSSSGISDVTIEIVDAGTGSTLDTFDPDSEGSATPCDGNAGDNIVVTAEVEHTISIPFFGTLDDVEITGRGEFRCEIDA